MCRAGREVTATIYIWKACVMLAWSLASGPVDRYQFEQREGDAIVTTSVPDTQRQACFPIKAIDYTVRVRGVDADGVAGQWSDDAIIHRVHDHDADGDGWVGFFDFSALVGAYLDVYRSDGVVEKH